MNELNRQGRLADTYKRHQPSRLSQLRHHPERSHWGHLQKDPESISSRPAPPEELERPDAKLGSTHHHRQPRRACTLSRTGPTPYVSFFSSLGDKDKEGVGAGQTFDMAHDYSGTGVGEDVESGIKRRELRFSWLRNTRDGVRTRRTESRLRKGALWPSLERDDMSV